MLRIFSPLPAFPPALVPNATPTPAPGAPRRNLRGGPRTPASSRSARGPSCSATPPPRGLGRPAPRHSPWGPRPVARPHPPREPSHLTPNPLRPPRPRPGAALRPAGTRLPRSPPAAPASLAAQAPSPPPPPPPGKAAPSGAGAHAAEPCCRRYQRRRPCGALGAAAPRAGPGPGPPRPPPAQRGQRGSGGGRGGAGAPRGVPVLPSPCSDQPRPRRGDGRPRGQLRGRARRHPGPPADGEPRCPGLGSAPALLIPAPNPTRALGAGCRRPQARGYSPLPRLLRRDPPHHPPRGGALEAPPLGRGLARWPRRRGVRG